MGMKYREKRTMVNQNINLTGLQSEQIKHDRGYHKDICALSHPDRLKHYALHFAKYVGRLSHSYSSREDRIYHTKKTIADCFIVALAAANTLDVDLQTEVNGSRESSSEYSWYVEETEQRDRSVSEARDWLFARLAEPMGCLSNAMESHDHMEPLATIQVFKEGVIEIVQILLEGAESIGIELDLTIDNRWSEIEKDHTV